MTQKIKPAFRMISISRATRRKQAEEGKGTNMEDTVRLTIDVSRSDALAFEEACKKAEKTPEGALKLLVSVSVVKGTLPIDLLNPYGFSNETLRAMADAEAGRNLEGPFATVEELMNALK